MRGLNARAWVVAAAIRDAQTPVELAGNAGVEVVRLDITDPAQITAVARTLAHHRFDLVLVNAGVTSDTTELSGSGNRGFYDYRGASLAW